MAYGWGRRRVCAPGAAVAIVPACLACMQLLYLTVTAALVHVPWWQIQALVQACTLQGVNIEPG
jgi:hypothetical protein